mmetsp:Transcript_51262/g.133119  ORF Transcript_51262/g.133119 Transcript_51262/m.133119 type:complete len:260 (-) Transcript_51262:711-1490(-)
MHVMERNETPLELKRNQPLSSGAAAQPIPVPPRNSEHDEPEHDKLSRRASASKLASRGVSEVPGRALSVFAKAAEQEGTPLRRWPSATTVDGSAARHQAKEMRHPAPRRAAPRHAASAWCLPRTTRRSDEWIHGVLEVEEVPDLLVVRLDRQRARISILAVGKELFGGGDEPASSKGVAADHKDTTEGARWREYRRRDRRQIVDEKDGARALSDLGWTQPRGEGIDATLAVALNIAEVLGDGDHRGVHRHEAREEAHGR